MPMLITGRQRCWQMIVLVVLSAQRRGAFEEYMGRLGT
jgi:hypothetical protein